MPEGPSIWIAAETIRPVFKGKKISRASGNARIDMNRITGQKITDIRSWGKHLLICFNGFTVRVHFLLFGSYNLDTHIKQDRSLRLLLVAGKRKVYFYTCSVKILEGNADELYDWSSDLLSGEWDPAAARKNLKKLPDEMACDVLLDQSIFSGSGNIIKNEVLYRIRLHPESVIKNIPPRVLSSMVKEERNYSFDFLRWKKAFTLKKHWLAHTKKTCLRCNLPFVRKHCGKTKRRSFFCTNCQIKY